MPATFAHPAFALWAYRFRLPPSALIAGSIAPDTGYLLLPYWRPWTGHTVLGIHTFGLPVGLLLLWIFHRWLEEATVDLFPAAWRSRLDAGVGTFRWGPWRRTFRIVAGVWLGAVTHVMVDSFTHYNGQVAGLWPEIFWRTQLGTGLAFCRELQFLGGLGGTAYLAAWGLQWYRDALPGRPRPRRLGVAWWMVAVVVGVLSVYWAWTHARGTGFDWWHTFGVHGATSGLILSAASLVVLAILGSFKTRD